MPFKTSRVGDALLAEYKQDPRYLMAMEQMSEGGSTRPVYSPAEGIARALQGMVGAYTAKKLGQQAEARQGEQYGAIADILAPKMEAETVKADLGPLGTLDASTPEHANPNRENIMKALQSGLITPSAIGPSVVEALGFGKGSEYDTTPRVGVNPSTGKREQYILDKQGNMKWLGVSPETKMEVAGNNVINPYEIQAGTRLPDTMSPEAEAQKARIAAAGKQTMQVNVGPTGIDYGKPDEGLVWKRDPAGKVMLDERGAPVAIPYQGGKAYIAEQDKARAEKNRSVIQRVASDVVVQDADKILGMAQSLPVAGFQGNLLKAIPGTPQRDVAGLVETIKSNVGFDKLQAMREASPTGGALGNVSEKELRSLQATIGDLEQSQSQEQFVRNVKRVREQYIDIVHGPGTAKRLDAERSKSSANKGSTLSPEEQAELAALRKRFGGGK